MKLTSCCDPQFQQYLEWPPIWLNRLSLLTSQCGVRFFIIILALTTFNFPITLNSLRRRFFVHHLIFGTVSYCSLSTCWYSSSFPSLSSYASFSTPFNLSLPYSIFCILLLYNKEAVTCTLCSLSASASRVAATFEDTASHNFLIIYLKNVFIFIIYSLVGVKGRTFITRVQIRTYKVILLPQLIKLAMFFVLSNQLFYKDIYLYYLRSYSHEVVIHRCKRWKCTCITISLLLHYTFLFI